MGVRVDRQHAVARGALKGEDEGFCADVVIAVPLTVAVPETVLTGMSLRKHRPESRRASPL